MNAHAGVEDNDAFERRTQRDEPPRLVVLLLLAYEQEAYLCVIDDVLQLLLAARGIKWYHDSSHSVGSEVGI